MRPGGFNLTVTAYNSWIYLLLNDIPSVHIRPLENVSMSLHQTAENSDSFVQTFCWPTWKEI